MNTDKLKELAKENGLTKEDFHKDKRGFVIIKREGIEKIQATQNIKVIHELIYHSDDLKTAIIKTVGLTDKIRVETFGEVSPANNNNKYPIAMAEKRGLSRAVLKISGFYKEGVYEEDESEEFKDNG